MKTILPATLLVLAVLVCFSNGTTAPFVMDDHGNIVGNEGLDALFPDPTRSRLGLRRAVGHLSFAVNYRLAGLEVSGFHWFNIAIHALATLCLFGVARRTLELDSTDIRFHSPATWIAFCIALLWAVHPLQTASVTYVIQRLESMMGLFYLLTLYCLLRGATSTDSSPETPAGPALALKTASGPLSRRQLMWYAAGIVAFTLGIGAKEVIATAPLVLLLYDRVFLSGSWKSVIRKRWCFYVCLLPAWIWLAYLISPAYQDPFPGKSGVEGASITTWEYLRSQPGVILHYLRLAFWPTGLCFDYAWPVAANWAAILIPGTLVVGLLTASVAAFWRQPWIGFLGLSFFIILSPTSSIMPIKDLCFDHRMYLPLAPIVTLVVVSGYAALLRRPTIARRPASAAELTRWLVGVCGALALLLGYLTVIRNEDYRSLISLWSDTVQKAPHNPRGYINLGNAYLGQRKHELAIRSYSQAIKEAETDALAFNNRGRAYLELDETQQALRDFTRAIQLDPAASRAFHNRGTLYVTLKEYEKAVADLTRAIELRPAGVSETYFTRGNAWLGLLQFEKAIGDYTRALQLDPHLVDALVNRGSAYLKSNRVENALQDFTSALTIQPTLVAALSNRALCYYHKREFRRALADVQQVLRLGGTVDERFARRLRAALERGP